MRKQLQKKDIFWQGWFEGFFHLSLFLMLFDWACPIPYAIGPFGFYEGALCLTAIGFVGCFVQEKGRFVSRLWQVLGSAKALVISFVAYVVFGFVTLLYGNNLSFGASRYIVVAQMAMFSVFLFYYLFPNEKADGLVGLKRLALNVGVTGFIIAVVAVFGYFSQWYTMYYQRISPIRDYNQYTTILLVCAVAFTVLLLNQRPLPFVKRYALLTVYWVVMATAVYLAGSRRSYVLLCLVAAVLGVYALYIRMKWHRKKGERLRTMGATVFGLGVCLVLCLGIASTTYNVVGELAPVRLQKALEVLESTPKDEVDQSLLESVLLSGEQTKLGETFAGIVDGSGFSSREAIWNAAYDKMKNADPVHLLFGYGSPYSWQLYDDLENPAVVPVREYYHLEDDITLWMNPHNFLLQDALEGGLVLVGIELALIAFTFFSFLKLLYRTPHTALPLAMMTGILYVTLVLSSGKGMVSHKFLWLFLVCQVAEMHRISRKKQMVG